MANQIAIQFASVLKKQIAMKFAFATMNQIAIQFASALKKRIATVN